MEDLLFVLIPWKPFFTILSFAWGASIGSFLNVCIYRIPRELSTVTPRSYCPHCKHQIAWYYNIPLFSFLFLRTKCAYCGGRISFRYFLVELLVAIFFLLAWLKFDVALGHRPLALSPIADWRLTPIYWLIISGLVLGAFVDFEHLIIPDRVTLGGIAAGLALSTLVPSLQGQERILQGFLRSAIGAAVGWGLLWGVAVFGKFLFRKDAMGFGDVKLLSAIGAMLGWQAVLFTLVVSSFVGSLVGIALVASGKKEMQSRIPFGPYLSFAAILWIFWGPSIWLAYLNWMLPEIPY
ncbi:MAG: prepilin peptidase [Lentisphaerae bacterium]|nr:prepilin peptidase [Lentisphaerota bacterium]